MPQDDGEGRKVADSLLSEPELFSHALHFRWKSGVRNRPSEVLRQRKRRGSKRLHTITFYFEVMTSRTTVPAFFPLAGLPFADFDFADLTAILPPAAVNARTS